MRFYFSAPRFHVWTAVAKGHHPHTTDALTSAVLPIAQEDAWTR